LQCPDAGQRDCKFLFIGLRSEAVPIKQMEKLQLSVRTFSRILKLRRTMADLEESKNVGLKHVAEAVSYRGLDRPLSFVMGKRDKRTPSF